MGEAVEACNSHAAVVHPQQYLLWTMMQPCKPLVREPLPGTRRVALIACKSTATGYCSVGSTMLL